MSGVEIPEECREEVCEVLGVAEGLIADRKRWTQRTMARTRAGNSISPNRGGATSWCAVGSVDHAAFLKYGRKARGREIAGLAVLLLDRLAEGRKVRPEMPSLGIVSVNDYGIRPHQQVLQVFKAARKRICASR